MFARFVCMLACVVLAHCLPIKQFAPEEFGVTVTSYLEDTNYEEFLKDNIQDTTKVTTDTNSFEEIAKDEEEDVPAEPQLENVSTEAGIKDIGDLEEIFENTRVKRDEQDRADIETIVTVKNNNTGTEKKYYFKTIDRNVKGQKYRCKIGLTTGDVIFYYRCLFISEDIKSGILQETGQTDLFDIA